MKVDLKEIKILLPHREPFLFLDYCEIIKISEEGKGFKKFLSNEYFFKGHFPEMPIVPGVILIESLAQTAGVVVSKGLKNNEDKSVLFLSVSNAKFRKPVFPNDEIFFNIKITNKVKAVYKCYGEAIRGSEKVCEANFAAMIIDKKFSNIV